MEGNIDRIAFGQGNAEKRGAFGLSFPAPIALGCPV